MSGINEVTANGTKSDNVNPGPVHAQRETIKIIRHGSARSWIVPKAALSDESGFFRALLASDFKETREHVVTLHDDDLWASDILFGSMASESLDKVLKDLVEFRHALGSGMGTEASVRTVTHLYLMADKYDMPKVRKTLVESLLPFIIRQTHIRLEARQSISNEMSPASIFMRAHYRPLVSQLTDYPSELFKVFLDFYIRTKSDMLQLSDVESVLLTQPELATFVLRGLRDTTQHQGQDSKIMARKLHDFLKMTMEVDWEVSRKYMFKT